MEHDTTVAYTFTVFDTIGCGYDTTIYITFYAIRHTELDTVVCESFMWDDSLYTQSGQYVQHLMSVVGCDSVFTLNLTVNNPSDTILNVTVLENNLPYVLNDSSYYVPGTYYQALENVFGCDSDIHLAQRMHGCGSFLQASSPLMSVTLLVPLHTGTSAEVRDFL